MQKATVGRVVHFFPATTDALYRNGEPLAATIVRVWSNDCVNLALFDGEANLHKRTSVLLYREDYVRPEGGYASWPVRESVTPETKLDSSTGELPLPLFKTATLAISDEMVGRFLSWPLPDDFSPDCGITFTRSPHAGMSPTGANLLHFGQAKAMLEHCINGPSASPEQPAASMDQATEQRIREAGADVAPRVSAQEIDALCDDLVIHTHHFPGTTTTVAVAMLPDGFVVATGHSACISPTNFKRHIGEQIASDNARAAARAKLWELEGYVLRSSLVSAFASAAAVS